MSEVLKHYTKLFGPEISGDVQLIEGHQHTRVKRSDGIVSPETAVDTAEALGMDLIITDHNTLEGVDRAFTRKANSGYNLEIVPAVEYTARNKEGSHRHIIALNVQQMPDPSLSIEEANRVFHRQGAKVVAAHPELGKYSATHDEIKDINHEDKDPEEQFDGMEIVNGGVAKAFKYTQGKIVRYITPLIKSLPQRDLNDQSIQVFQKNGHKLFPYGGSDGHSAKEIGDVIIVRSSNMTTMEALQKGEVAIYVREKPSHVSVLDYLKKLGINAIDKL